MMQDKSKKIGFVGQGYVGKNYADDFESRGFSIVRYALEPPYRENKDKLKDCEIVFIAVPTPTTPKGFDDSIVKEALGFVSDGSVAVIKSTVIPGTTERLQKENPKKYVFHSPEFLTEATASEDVKSPDKNIVGIPEDTNEYRARAEEVMKILPKAPHEIICLSREAELFKYLRNCFFYTKVVYMNVLYDTAKKLDCDWEVIREMILGDKWIANKHLDPIHKNGRGAGGNCFIKDHAAFIEFYRSTVGDVLGIKLLQAIENKNIDLLTSSGKDTEKLRTIYGEAVGEETK